MTITSNSYEKALRHVEGQVVVESLACPPFVPLVESMQTDVAYVERVVASTLRPLMS
jgi:glutamate racemase